MDLHDQPTEPMNTDGQGWPTGGTEYAPDQQHQQTSYVPPQDTYQAPYSTPPPATARAGGHTGMAPRLVAGIAALSLLVGGAAGAGAGALVSHSDTGNAASSGTVTGAAPVAQSERVISTDVSDLTVKVVRQVGPAVVSIRNDQQPQQELFGTSQAVSAGSGVVIDSHGYILTNYHVVADAQNLTVTFANATTAPATIVGTDPSNDIAVIKVNTKVPAVAQFGDSSKVQVGETVIAVGNALGNLQNTVTEGIVSGVNRTLPSSTDATGQPTQALQNMIQTDAAINHGNSGGPLVDLSGHVIGINTAVVRSSGDSSILSTNSDQAEGLGFAIPSNTAQTVADRLIFHTPSPSLGVEYQAVTAQMASSYGLHVGAWVLKVVPGSAAASAGLKLRDIITAVNGQAVDDQHDLKSLIEDYHVGDKIKLSIYRGGQTISITATLGKSAS